MTTLVPRSPYTDAELAALYPKSLRLEHVQIILRHGERTPVSARFRNTGLPDQWPYCKAANRLAQAVMTADGWDVLSYRRRIETLGLNDLPTLAKGPKDELNSICLPGELTDEGRSTTLGLGQRLRNLYINQLHFIPDTLTNPDTIYLRATPIPRALESVQQAFTGLYPPAKRDPRAPYPTIITRAPADETLYPNDANCKRFGELMAAFADRTALRWNESPEMDLINKKIAKWMPKRSPRVQVDSHPRLSGVMDTINSTLSHGPEVRLPSEFYDPQVRAAIDKIGSEEWFSGYAENQEYRTVGIGGLVGDLVTRMVGHVEQSRQDGSSEVGVIGGESDARIRFAMSGAHDTTLAAVLTSMGAFKGEPWPPYTSHIAVELFKDTGSTPAAAAAAAQSTTANNTAWWTSLFRLATLTSNTQTAAQTISRTLTPDLTPSQSSLLTPYYVRLRYNDRPMPVPGCKPAGKHFPGDESICTLAAFKEIADKFTPRDWKEACSGNLGTAVPEGLEEAGY